MNRDLAFVPNVLGRRWEQFAFQLVAVGGVTQLSYNMLALQTFFSTGGNAKRLIAMTIMDPTGKGAAPYSGGANLASAATVNKGYVYLQDVRQTKIWNAKPIADLIPSTNVDYIFLGEDEQQIDWQNSNIFWGNTADIAGGDINLYVILNVLYEYRKPNTQSLNNN